MGEPSDRARATPGDTEVARPLRSTACGTRSSCARGSPDGERNARGRASELAGARRARRTGRPGLHQPCLAGDPIAHVRGLPDRHSQAGARFCTRRDLDVAGPICSPCERAHSSSAGAGSRRARPPGLSCCDDPGGLRADRASWRSPCSGSCGRGAEIPARGRRSTRRSRSCGRPLSFSGSRRWLPREPRPLWLESEATERRRHDPGRPSRWRCGAGPPGISASLPTGAGRPVRERRSPAERRRAYAAAARAVSGSAPRSCWTEIGCPYEAALALADADDDRRAAPSARRAARARRTTGGGDRRAPPARARRARRGAGATAFDAGKSSQPDRPRARGPRARRAGPAQRRDRRAPVPLQRRRSRTTSPRSCASSTCRRGGRPAPRRCSSASSAKIGSARPQLGNRRPSRRTAGSAVPSMLGSKEDSGCTDVLDVWPPGSH